jgi:hypothetical protein
MAREAMTQGLYASFAIDFRLAFTIPPPSSRYVHDPSCESEDEPPAASAEVDSSSSAARAFWPLLGFFALLSFRLALFALR